MLGYDNLLCFHVFLPSSHFSILLLLSGLLSLSVLWLVCTPPALLSYDIHMIYVVISNLAALATAVSIIISLAQNDTNKISLTQ